MKYITQDWTSTKDGYLFFVQRLQEIFRLKMMVALNRLKESKSPL